MFCYHSAIAALIQLETAVTARTRLSRRIVAHATRPGKAALFTPINKERML
jgi:hypothetical protein